MNDDTVVSFDLQLPPPTEAQSKEADALAVGIFMLAQKRNASPQILLYAMHRVLNRMESMAKAHD